MKITFQKNIFFYAFCALVLSSFVVLPVFSLSIDTNDLTKNSSNSAEQIREKIWRINQRGLTLKLGDEKVNPSFDEIGVVFNEDELIKKFKYFNKDDIWTRVQRIFNRFLKIKIEIDRAKMKSYLEKVAGDKFARPVNAEVQLNDGKFEIIKGKQGKAISSKLLISSLKKQLNETTDPNLVDKISITLEFKDTDPPIIQDDLAPRIIEAEYYSKTPFVFQFEDNRYTTDATEIKKWISFTELNQEIKVEFDENAINTYLDSIASNIDIKPYNKVIEIAGNIRKVVTPGKKGRALNRELVIAEVRSKLSSLDRIIQLETEVLEPKEVFRYQGNVSGGVYPGKYIEIDVSARQKLRLWVGEKLIATYTISSGKAGYRTPTGHYRISSKNPRAYSSKYGLYMPYWMAFTGAGHGIHELPEWPGGYKEGANHLGIRVSHGCVRLGVGAAGHAYGWSPIGTPVYIHY